MNENLKKIMSLMDNKIQDYKIRDKDQKNFLDFNLSLNKKFCTLMGRSYWVNLFILMLFPYFLFAQFNQPSTRSLFSDPKAFKQGDQLTILIVEDMQANNGATTANGRSSDVSAGLDFSTGTTTSSPSMALKHGSNFAGNGSTSRSETIRSKLTAKVTSVDPSGNMLIEGKRTTKLNGETQTITIKGTARQVDILPDNSILSYNILDLTLTIEGDGSVSKYQEPGLITKFLRLLF